MIINYVNLFDDLIDFSFVLVMLMINHFISHSNLTGLILFELLCISYFLKEI